MGLEVIQEIIGKNPAVHALIAMTACLYFYFLLTKPKFAKKCAEDSLGTIKSLIPPIIASLFIAGAIKSLLPSKVLAGFLGEEAGLMAVFIGIAIGSILPACPFISYPIIAGVYAAGASLVGTMAMLFGSGLAFPCRITADLIFFKPRVAGVRMLLSLGAAIIAGLLIYLIL